MKTKNDYLFMKNTICVTFLLRSKMNNNEITQLRIFMCYIFSIRQEYLELVFTFEGYIYALKGVLSDFTG
jgi:hypothetical protein